MSTLCSSRSPFLTFFLCLSLSLYLSIYLSSYLSVFLSIDLVDDEGESTSVYSLQASLGSTLDFDGHPYTSAFDFIRDGYERLADGEYRGPCFEQASGGIFAQDFQQLR